MQRPAELAEAWDRYTAETEAARHILESEPTFERPDHQGRAYRALVESQAMAYAWVMAPSVRFPRINSTSSWSTSIYTLGMNCPDFSYGTLLLDGRGTYRLRARYGGTRILLIQVLSRPFGQPGSVCTGNYEYGPWLEEAGGDGEPFDIVLSATEQPGHWIPLDRDSKFNFLMLRRAMGDWFDDPGDLDVQVIDAPPEDDEHSVAAVAERLHLTAGVVRFLAEGYSVGLPRRFLQCAGGRTNHWGAVAGVALASDGGSPTCNYGFLTFALEPDEALITEYDVPEGSAYWSFQIGDMWSRSYEFVHRQSDVNMDRAVLDDDGVFRAVVSARDPGVPNWLDTQGYLVGTGAMRNYHAETLPVPQCRVVKLDDLRRELPASTPATSPEQRAAEIERRRQGYRHLYEPMRLAGR
jgi:hypothetical protein